MKNLLLSLFTLCCFSSLQAGIVGSSLTYTTTSTPGVYQIKLVLMRDCAGEQICSSCPTSLSASCNKPIQILGADTGIYNGNYIATQYLSVVTSLSGFDVQQGLGPNAKTNCSNCGTRTPGTVSGGVEYYTFTGLVNLSGLPAGCCKVKITYGTCCQDTSRSMLKNPTSQGVYTEVIINRCLTENYWITNHSEFVKRVCSGNDVQFRVVEQLYDTDSLSFALAPVYTDSNAVAVYDTPYSATVPFPYAGAPAQMPPAAYPNGIKVDAYTGDVYFRPLGTFRANLPIEIKKWRKVNGLPELAGKVQLNYEINSEQCSNTTPQIEANSNNQNNQLVTFEKKINVQAGRPVCLNIKATDALTGDDTTTLYFTLYDSLTQLGATVTRNFNPLNRRTLGPKYDSARFCWTPPAGKPLHKQYAFLVRAQDYSYPVTAQAYTKYILEYDHVRIQSNKGNAFCQGDSVKLFTDSLPGITFQWFKNNLPIPGATHSFLNTADSGGYQVLTKFNNLPTDTSYVFTVSYFPKAKAAIFPHGDVYACKGDTFDLLAPLSTGYTLQWLKNNSPVSGAVQNYYRTTQPGKYNVIYYNNNGCFDTSIEVTVNYSSIGMATLSDTGSISICAGNGKWLKGITDSGNTMLWYKDNTQLFPTHRDSIEITAAGLYWFNSFNNYNCTRTSDSLMVTVNPKPAVGNIQTSAGIIYPDSLYAYSVQQLPNLSYTWSITNGQLMSGQGTAQIVVKWFLLPGCKLRVRVSNASACDSVSEINVTVTPRPPLISGFNPDSGYTNTTVTIRGKYFNQINRVSFGTTNAASYVVLNDSVILAVVGSGSSGNVIVDGTYGIASKPWFSYMGSVGFNEFTGNGKVKIYPNPSDNIIYMLAENMNDIPVSISVYNVLGQWVMEETGGNMLTEIPVKNLQAGTYFLVWHSQDKVYYAKFIKY